MTATGGVKRDLVAADAAVLLLAWTALPTRLPRMPLRATMPPAPRLVAGVLLAAVAVGGAMVVLDAWAFAAQRLLAIPVVDAFNWITDFGKSGWFLWPIGLLIVALAFVAATTPGRLIHLTIVAVVVRLEFLFAAIAIPGLAVTIVKRLIGRVRPSQLGPFAYVPLSWRPDYASMPSGHATTAFAAAVAIGAVWPRARPLLWLYAIVIALSRVVIAAHYTSDVIAGALVGGFAALIVRNYYATRRLGFSVAPDGSVHRLPGPSWRRIRAIAARLFAAS